MRPNPQGIILIFLVFLLFAYLLLLPSMEACTR